MNQSVQVFENQKLTVLEEIFFLKKLSNSFILGVSVVYSQSSLTVN